MLRKKNYGLDEPAWFVWAARAAVVLTVVWVLFLAFLGYSAVHFIMEAW